MSEVWFTSDTHFNHDKNFIWEDRGFHSIREMNEIIIALWNQVVKPEDIVYHLGDVMLGTDYQEGLKYLQRLNGKKYLAIGNHDTTARINLFKNENVFQDIQIGYQCKFGKNSIIATHFPTITANGNDNHILNFYGHTHQKTNFFSDCGGIRTYMYHVGMDSHCCAPVNIDEIKAEIKQLKYS